MAAAIERRCAAGAFLATPADATLRHVFLSFAPFRRIIASGYAARLFAIREYAVFAMRRCCQRVECIAAITLRRCYY